MDKTRFVNIESERLMLRRFADKDLAAFLAYANDPEVSRYQSWESVRRGL
jgi:RimJ/RimL family protein N-acetyltransferase